MRTFTYTKNSFYKNGKPHKIYAGAMHYFRIMPQSWRDRLLKLKNIGFNAVETYVCWSLHERKEGVFDFSGRLDLGRFIDEAHSLGLDAIIRPGPFICAETDFGGLPSWLLTYPEMELRCDNALFLEKVDNYFKALAPILQPRLYANGGNILMMQVENEYGSYGNDKVYLEKLKDMYRKYDFNCMLFSADGTCPQMLEDGPIPEIYEGLTFGSKPEYNFSLHTPRQPQPNFCVEYWNGWFDVYGGEHHTREADDVCRETEEFIEHGNSFNFYMFCGGTNFGMINGANHIDGKYCFQTTSYDYGAPLTESGDMTDKYIQLKALMENWTGEKIDLPVSNSKKRVYADITSQTFAPLLDNLPEKKLRAPYPKTLETLGVDFGYALYSTEAVLAEDSELWLRGLRDRATVLVNGVKIATLDQDAGERVAVEGKGEKVKIDILVENRGRCNYGYQLKDPKGILGGVLFRNKFLMGFDQYALVAELPENLIYRERRGGDEKQPGYYKFHLEIEGEPADTFIYPEGFVNGCIFVNGVNIGRYCNHQPPQRTLYLPAELLKEGKNEIVIFETDGTSDPTVTFHRQHIFAECRTR